MREVKFRAWEKNLKEMIPVDNINFEYRLINQTSAWRLFDEIELMQYTGLKDKNGKEIYEGDIIQLYGVEYYKEVLWTGQGYGYKVIKNATRSTGYIEGHLSERGLNFYTHESEVIGNIYANPELLEKGK